MRRSHSRYALSGLITDLPARTATAGYTLDALIPGERGVDLVRKTGGPVFVRDATPAASARNHAW